MAEFLPLDEAVQRIRWDSTLALGGLTLYRRPMALVRHLLRRHALLARRRAELTLATLTCAFESDLLVGAGAVETVRTCYFGLEIFGLAPMFTSHASKLKIIDESEASICAGYLTAIGRKPALLPGREEPWKAIPIDVALIHATEADREGRVRFEGNLGCDRDIALLAPLTIVSAERIVNRVENPILEADIVCEAPKGAWPTSCYPDYSYDGLEILRYITACKEGQFYGYLNEFLAR